MALSGGVDSSVAALKLKEDGYNLEGCTLLLLNWLEDCCFEGANLARDICEKLNISHSVFGWF